MLKYYEYFPSVMECLSDGRCYKTSEIIEYCCEKLKISEEDKKQVLSSGQPVVSNRVNWAVTYLRKAKLIESPQRGTSQITDRGKEALKGRAENITLAYLHKFKEFNEFCHVNKGKSDSGNIPDLISDESPQEQIEKAISQINSNLADELMTEITKIAPYEFERLVVQLLIKMGYGSQSLNETAVTKKSGDEGIDGIISADRFGFDTVYVQAKDGRAEPLNMNQAYEDLQMSNPWFDEAYRVMQSKLFAMALRVRKQFLYENRKNIKAALRIWKRQHEYLERKPVIVAAWNWMNMIIPVISSTFASFSRMCKNLGAETLGHLFIDEAGQALPQAAVGAIYRSRHVMVVGDPQQIKPVLTLDSNILYMLGRHFGVTEKYLSASASVQTLVDAASQYGFYRKQDKSEDSWVGIPLWVHRRCRYPMFTISNMISYDGLMVQGMKKYGKTGWFDVGGMANDKYVEAQGEFLLQKLREMIAKNPKIIDKKEKDVVYVITPFSNVAYQLSKKLRKIHFTRYDEHGKSTNVGTVHTFQGKEAPIVFFVLGADQQSSGAARWAVDEANIMNVAATRAKEEFYIIGDRKLYLGLGCDVVTDTDRIIRQYKNQHPDLVHDQIYKTELRMQVNETQTPVIDADLRRITGTVKYVGKGTKSFYAYIAGVDGKEYSITENIYLKTEHAIEVIQKGKKISFVPEEGKKKLFATEVKTDV